MITDNNLLLRKDQLAVLLANSSVKKFFGFQLTDDNESAEEYIYAVKKLHDDKIVYRQGERLELCREYSEILEKIVTSSMVIIYRSGDLTLDNGCLYYNGSDSFTACETISYKRNSVRLREIQINNLTDELKESGFLNENFDDAPDPDGSELSEDVLELVDNMREYLGKINDVRVMLSLNVFNKHGNEKCAMYILNLPRGVYSVFSTGEINEVKPYSNDSISDFIMSIVQGDIIR